MDFNIERYLKENVKELIGFLEGEWRILMVKSAKGHEEVIRQIFDICEKSALKYVMITYSVLGKNIFIHRIHVLILLPSTLSLFSSFIDCNWNCLLSRWSHFRWLKPPRVWIQSGTIRGAVDGVWGVISRIEWSWYNLRFHFVKSHLFSSSPFTVTRGHLLYLPRELMGKKENERTGKHVSHGKAR